VGDERAVDDEVRALPTADLVLDHAAHDVRVLVVGHVEPALLDGDLALGQQAEHVVQGHALALADDQVAQRRSVVLRGEPALAHLSVGDEGEDVLAVQRDVGEPLDVDDVAGEDVHLGPALPEHDGERQ
jgi:hypothetical protein